MFEGFDQPRKGGSFLSDQMNGGMILSFFKRPIALLTLKTFGEHSGEVSSFLLTALIIVVV